MNVIYLQRRFTAKLAKILGMSVLVILIVSYALWRSLNYARGPEIVVTSPVDGIGISASTTEIVGKIERAVNLSLNGRSITTDEEGNFKETIIIFKGNNILSLEASDQFERSTKSTLTVYGVQH